MCACASATVAGGDSWLRSRTQFSLHLIWIFQFVCVAQISYVATRIVMLSLVCMSVWVLRF